MISIMLSQGAEPGTAAIIAEEPCRECGKVRLVTVGTARPISAGFWEADLIRARPELGPQGPEPGRGPMENGRAALRMALEKSANEDGPWWPAGERS